jgi:hypothetical protein
MSGYLCVWIPVASFRDVAGVEHVIPAHLLCLSVPWIHPQRRRRVHRRGRR